MAHDELVTGLLVALLLVQAEELAGALLVPGILALGGATHGTGLRGVPLGHLRHLHIGAGALGLGGATRHGHRPSAW